MKNNKGITIVEIIVSIVLISLVALMLFRLLIQLRSDDQKNEIRATLLTIESRLSNAVQEDVYSLGVNHVAHITNQCDNFTNTDCCCLLGNNCLKIYFETKEVREISLYEQDSTLFIKYRHLNLALPKEVSFDSLLVSKSHQYKSLYRFDTITKASIALITPDDKYPLDFVFPSKEEAHNYCEQNED